MGRTEHEAYCPRCDAVTTWWNVAKQGNRYGCKVCRIQETDQMTDEEIERMGAHPR